MTTYARAECSLGHVLVAATSKGVCFVGIGDTPDQLEATLQHYRRTDTFQRDDAALQHWLDQLIRFCQGDVQSFDDMPFDIHGTPFQKRVWEMLCTIPYGKTRSYRDVAHMIQLPTAARAVANACGANPLTLVIPCHRVVRSDGGLGGYGSGIERKKALLAMEAKQK